MPPYVIDYESRDEPLASRRRYAIRLAFSGLVSALIIALSLGAGMYGYHHYENLAWIDAFLNAAMILGGMGPVANITTDGGKIFAGVYALYSGLIVLVTAGIILAPIAHRILHRFHVDEDDSD
ncbi:MAG: hypothetical protein AB7K67_07680 [Hyphomicrobiaceae bacterium]